MKTSLVLEGGGMRGAYTAGCLAWLIDNGITFDSAYGISTGAVHLCSYLCADKDYLYDLSTNHIVDKALIGIRPLIREHHFVGYDYLFSYILPVLKHYDLDKAKRNSCKSKIGIYDLDGSGTSYIEVKDIDPKMELLKAACSLPIIGKVVKYNGHKYLDGGITKMIPIEESLNDQNECHLVIATKPKDYVRKPSPWYIKLLMRIVYPKSKKLAADYGVRHLNYNKQIAIIKDLVNEDKAIYLFPSKEIPVTRLGGDKEHLRILYDLGYKDMEQRKDAIYKMFKKV